MVTPEEIEHKEFVAAMRGFDRDEVTAYLRAVAEEVRALQARVDSPPERVAAAPVVDLESQIGTQVAEILRSARAAAESTSEETARELAAQRADAERYAAGLRGEAARVLDEAKATAADLVARARAEADDIVQEALLRQERVEAANQSALGVLGQADRQLADLRAALVATRAQAAPAREALEDAVPA